MNMQVTIGLNAETLSIISELSAAIRSVSGSAPQTTVAAPAKTESRATKPAAAVEAASDDEPVVIYWFSAASDTFGIVESEEAFKALKKKDVKVVKWTEAKYEAKLAQIEAAKAEEEAGEEGEVPTEADVIEAFGAYLPADLDKAERAERAAFVKPMLARFGAKKASELPEEHRRLAINLVQRKAAGQDVDPETDEFEEFDADEDGLV